MKILQKLIDSLPDGEPISVQVGLFWTVVIAQVNDSYSCGLAATFSERPPGYDRQPLVNHAGRLMAFSARELAQLALSGTPTETSIGLAAINALLPKEWAQGHDQKAEDFLRQHGAGKNVVVVGHFAFVDRLKEIASRLSVLELKPWGDDLPAEAAPDVIPAADVVAITATTLINRTLDGLLALCRPGAQVLLVGPSTPLSPLLFEHGITALSGTVVEDPGEVLRMASQGATFKQISQNGGVRLVTAVKGSG